LTGLNKVVAGILKGMSSAGHGMMILRLRVVAAFCFWNLSFPLLSFHWISMIHQPGRIFISLGLSRSSSDLFGQPVVWVCLLICRWMIGDWQREVSWCAVDEVGGWGSWRRVMPSRDSMVNWDVRYADCSSSVQHVAFEMISLILFWMPRFCASSQCTQSTVLDNAGVQSLIWCVGCEFATRLYGVSFEYFSFLVTILNVWEVVCIPYDKPCRFRI
jgi:hypothetical protein